LEEAVGSGETEDLAQSRTIISYSATANFQYRSSESNRWNMRLPFSPPVLFTS